MNFDTDKASLIAAIGAAGGTYISDRKISCFHGPDRNPSANLIQDATGKWRMHCHTCGFHGDQYDLGAPQEELKMKTSIKVPEQAVVIPKKLTKEEVSTSLAKLADGSPISKYAYTRNSQLVGVVVRVDLPDGKQFRQITPLDDGWTMRGPDQWPPYQIDQVDTEQSLLIVEGEKAANLATSLGLNAITWAGGCKAVAKTDWGMVQNKRVVLWPDNDEPGIAAMQQVAMNLPASQCKTIEVQSLVPSKGDICEYMAEHTQEELRELLTENVPQNASSRLRERAKRVLRGELLPVPTKDFPILAKTTQFMSPGGVTVLVGTGGGGKSTFLTQCMRGWLQAGYPVACLMLESGKDYHITRALAQEMQCADLLDPEWASNPDHADQIDAFYEAGSSFIETMDTVIHDTPPDMATIDYVIDWMTARAEGGKRVIIVDPVTMISYNDPKAISDGSKRLVKQAIALAGKHECSILLVNHFNKDGLTMQGGASLMDHTDVVLEFQALEEEKELAVRRTGLKGVVDDKAVSRTILVRKSRKGTECWHKLGLLYDLATNTYLEQGVLHNG